MYYDDIAMTDKNNCKIEAERQKFMKLTRAMFFCYYYYYS